MDKNKRLRILLPDEIHAYFGRPKFTNTERVHYLSLSKDELDLCNTLSKSTRWYFILLLGFFKAKNQFFNIDHSYVRGDVHFIYRTYNFQKPKKNVSEDTHRKIREMIITQMGFNNDNNYVAGILQKKTKELVSTSPDIKFIFQSLYEYAVNKNLITPQYTTFQKIISEAIISEEHRLNLILKKYIPQYAIESLKEILSIKENYYEITAVKKDQKNFTHDEVKVIIKHKLNYNRLYLASKRVIPNLHITSNMVSYYSSLAVFVNKVVAKNIKQLLLIFPHQGVCFSFFG